MDFLSGRYADKGPASTECDGRAEAVSAFQFCGLRPVSIRIGAFKDIDGVLLRCTNEHRGTFDRHICNPPLSGSKQSGFLPRPSFRITLEHVDFVLCRSNEQRALRR